MSRHGTYDLKFGFVPDDDCPQQETPKQTNADRIRAMTDEELAEFIDYDIHGFQPPFCDVDRIHGSWCELNECDECIRRWLKQEADNG